MTLLLPAHQLLSVLRCPAIPIVVMLSSMKTHLFLLIFASAVISGCENAPSTPDQPSRGSSAAAPSKSTRTEPAAGCCVASEELAIPPRQFAEQKSEPAPEAVPERSFARRTEMEEEKETPPEKDPPIPDSFKPLNKEKLLFFEKTADGKRRVHVLAEVCLREGPLEVFLCKANTKEHESIVHADVDARAIHTALVAAGAKPGSTVKFVPDYKPATGSVIKVSVTYFKDGKLLTKPAQYWVQNLRTKKQMEHEWVFAGSRLFKYPDDPDKPPFYCANNGEVISIANFSDSMLDLPVKSSKENAELGFTANTERIPPLKTKVIVTLEPVGGG
jgi:hypothetical protein